MKWGFLVFLCLTGCGFSGGIYGAGEGMNKLGTAKLMESYNDYVIKMERVNIDREKAKLEPRPILPYQQWLNGQQKANGEVPGDYQPGDAWYEESH